MFLCSIEHSSAERGDRRAAYRRAGCHFRSGSTMLTPSRNTEIRSGQNRLGSIEESVLRIEIGDLEFRFRLGEAEVVVSGRGDLASARRSDDELPAQ